MIYESIPGWFQYQDVYEKAVSKAKDGDVFVELGTFRGRSTAFMAETIKESGKKIKFYTLDNHDFYRGMTPEEREHNNVAGGFDFTIEDVKRNLAPLADYVTVCKGESWEGIEGVDRVDFCWIDASHEYEAVKKDLAYWLPRSKVIGGDDYGFYGVRKAVTELNVPIYATESGGWLLDPNPFYRP